jgi:hypothetical protein
MRFEPKTLKGMRIALTLLTLTAHACFEPSQTLSINYRKRYWGFLLKCIVPDLDGRSVVEETALDGRVLRWEGLDC